MPSYLKAKRIFLSLISKARLIYACKNRYCEKVSHEKPSKNNPVTCTCGQPIEYVAAIFDIIPKIRSVFSDPKSRDYLKHHLSQELQDIVTDICQARRFHVKKQLYGSKINDIYVGLHQDG